MKEGDLCYLPQGVIMIKQDSSSLPVGHYQTEKPVSALVLENESLSPLDLRNRFKTTGFSVEFNSINISRLDVYNAVLNNMTLEIVNITLPQVNESNFTGNYSLLACDDTQEECTACNAAFGWYLDAYSGVTASYYCCGDDGVQDTYCTDTVEYGTCLWGSYETDADLEGTGWMCETCGSGTY